jgi:hypothetical protein
VNALIPKDSKLKYINFWKAAILATNAFSACRNLEDSLTVSAELRWLEWSKPDLVFFIPSLKGSESAETFIKL